MFAKSKISNRLPRQRDGLYRRQGGVIINLKSMENKDALYARFRILIA
jgi:hypothetical protein